MTDRTHSGLWGRGIERRAFLRGLGVCIALPTLESFAGPVLKAATRAGAVPRLATTAGGMPLRLGFIGFANGSNYERWLPQGTGRDYTLNETFEPIGDMRQRFQILTSLAHDAANSWGDGPGDHARAGATFLTGCHAWKTLGAQLHLGISVDQIAARQVGHLTRLDSLQLGVEGARMYGSCDTGYPCAYQYNISWASETLPLRPSRIPARFLRNSSAAEPTRNGLPVSAAGSPRNSVLDFVSEDLNGVEQQLGQNDRRKVAEYLEGVRSSRSRSKRRSSLRFPRRRSGCRPASRRITASTST